jgi:GDPmannose 4,6-dehydratase
VGDLVAAAFAAAGVDPAGRIEVDPSLVRAAHGLPVVGDPSRARERLGWTSRTTLEELIGAMVAHDLAALDAQADAGLRSRR